MAWMAVSVRGKLGDRIVTAMSTALPAPDAPVVSVAGVIARMEAIAAALPAADGLACFNRMYRVLSLRRLRAAHGLPVAEEAPGGTVRAGARMGAPRSSPVATCWEDRLETFTTRAAGAAVSSGSIDWTRAQGPITSVSIAERTAPMSASSAERVLKSGVSDAL
jgi:hypothetical protein